jgi:hypothetical protein
MDGFAVSILCLVVANTIIVPFGIWKIIEIVAWVYNHVRVEVLP